MVAAAESAARRDRRRGGEVERTVEPDRNLVALASILTVDARERDDVVAFRRVVLRGRLIRSHRVGKWIEARARKEGAPPPFVEAGRLRPGVTFTRLRVEYFDLDESDDTGEVSIRPRYVHVVSGGVLDSLRVLADRLSSRYGWNPAYASRFVLTDEPPPLLRARVTLQGKAPFAATARITLDVSGRMTPDEVRALYVEARDKLAGPTRVRDLGEKAAELAVFAFEHRAGHRWADVMGIWNKRQPEWSYTDERRFNRDARQAFLRVTGDSLDWIGTEG
jgi:hypothetical protein